MGFYTPTQEKIRAMPERITPKQSVQPPCTREMGAEGIAEFSAHTTEEPQDTQIRLQQNRWGMKMVSAGSREHIIPGNLSDSVFMPAGDRK